MNIIRDPDRREVLAASAAVAASSLIPAQAHLQFCRCRSCVGLGRLSRDRAVYTRLRQHALPLKRYGPQRPAVGGRRRHYRLDGCAQDREADPRWLRLGRAHRQYHRGAVARALQSHGFGERLSDRQSRIWEDATATQGRAAMVVPILLRHRPRLAFVAELKILYIKNLFVQHIPK